MALTFISCATLPKTVNSGDTLTIGRIEMELSGYDDNTFNGKQYSGIEMYIREPIGSERITVRPDKEGYFYIKNLKPNTSYIVCGFKFTARSGAAIEWPDSFWDLFITKDDSCILNIGTYSIKYNSRTNQQEYFNGFPFIVKENFKSLEEDSEWLSKPIIDK